MWYDLDFDTAAREYSRALELEPTNPDILLDASQLLALLDRGDEAIELIEHLLDRDPINSSLHSFLGGAYGEAGRAEEALESFRIATALSPDGIANHYLAAGVLVDDGDLDAALVEIQLEPYEPYRLLGLARIYNAMGQAAQSDSALERLIDDHADEWAYNIAYTYAYRGEADAAFEWLERAIENHDAGLSDLGATGSFANIEQDPRWLPFLESLGMAPDQLAAIEFEVEIPE